MIASAALMVLFGGSAIAADLPVKAPPPAVCPTCNWTGFYVGLNVGGSIGQDYTSNAVSLLPPGGAAGVTNPISNVTDTRSPSGLIGGGQIGFNWQFNHWLVGVEADFDWSGQRNYLSATNFLASTVVVAPTTYSYSDEQRVNWLTTWRGRVGWTQDCWLWYVTGGGAWAEVQSNYSLSMNSITGGAGPFGTVNAAAGFTTRRTGWTVGGGVETKLSGIGGAAFNNWSFKAEYLYVDLGNVNNLFVAPVTAGAPTSMVLANSTTFHDHIVRVGVNYSFGGWAPGR